MPTGALQVHNLATFVFLTVHSINFLVPPKMVFATGCGFVQNYYIYVALRFLIAVNVSGAYMIGFVLSTYFVQHF